MISTLLAPFSHHLWRCREMKVGAFPLHFSYLCFSTGCLANRVDRVMGNLSNRILKMKILLTCLEFGVTVLGPFSLCFHRIFVVVLLSMSLQTFKKKKEGKMTLFPPILCAYSTFPLCVIKVAVFPTQLF